MVAIHLSFCTATVFPITHWSDPLSYRVLRYMGDEICFRYVSYVYLYMLTCTFSKVLHPDGRERICWNIEAFLSLQDVRLVRS